MRAFEPLSLTLHLPRKVNDRAHCTRLGTTDLAAIVLWAVLLVGLSRSADFRVLNSSPEPLDRYFPLVGLPLHFTIAASLILIIVGVGRRVDEALYVTALAAGVVFAAYTLLASVISQEHGSPGGPPPSAR